MGFILNQARIKSSTQDFIDIVEIIGEIIVLRNGDYLKIVEIKPVNFSLLNPEEQAYLINKFANFINSLDFPIQIYIHNQKIAMTDYLDFLKSLSPTLNHNPRLKAYLLLYASYINNIVEFKTIFDKRFYIVIKHHEQPYKASLPSHIKRTILEAVENRLAPKVATIRTHFKQMGLDSKVLKTDEAAKLFYKIYNPNTKSIKFSDNTKVNL